MDAHPRIGLPPRDPPAQIPDGAQLWRARAVNLIGLVSPAANVAMFSWSPPELRWFGVGAGAACAIGMFWGMRAEVEWLRDGSAGVHYALVLMGLIHPLWVELPARAWNAFGALIGRVMALPIFSLLFYLAVTPTALAVRLLGRDPLARKAPPGESYWVDHTPPEKERYERQF